jgi:hypothetical protein
MHFVGVELQAAVRNISGSHSILIPASDLRENVCNEGDSVLSLSVDCLLQIRKSIIFVATAVITTNLNYFWVLLAQTMPFIGRPDNPCNVGKTRVLDRSS